MIPSALFINRRYIECPPFLYPIDILKFTKVLSSYHYNNSKWVASHFGLKKYPISAAWKDKPKYHDNAWTRLQPTIIQLEELEWKTIEFDKLLKTNPLDEDLLNQYQTHLEKELSKLQSVLFIHMC